MFDNTTEIFDKFQAKIRVHKKKDYESIFNIFLNSNRTTFKEMYGYMASSVDITAAAVEIATQFTDGIMRDFSKKGKLSRGMKLDLSLFMIYYLFPALLKSSDPASSKILCEAIRDKWRECSGNKEYDYTTYDEIYQSFNEKIFGMF